MARNVSGYEQKKTRIYIPRAFGNDKDPADPVQGEIVTPSEEEKRAIVAEMGDTEKLSDLFVWQAMIVRRFVKSVSNYTNKGVVITDGATLAEYGETEMVSDFAAEIYGDLSLKEDEKKD